MFFGLLGWVIIGAIVGFVVSKAINLRGDDPRLGIGVAAGSAVLAGVAYAVIRGAGVSAFDPWALLCAAVGAALGLLIWHGVRSRYVSRAAYTRRSSY